jgi:hypothetical protein
LFDRVVAAVSQRWLREGRMHLPPDDIDDDDDLAFWHEVDAEVRRRS